MCQRREEALAEEADSDRSDDDIEDAQEHAEGVDVDESADREPYEQRSQEGCENSRGNSHADREGEVSTGEEGDNIGGRPARAAADEDHADSQFRREIENLSQGEGEGWHDNKLSAAADDDVARSREDNLEVNRVESQSHPEHDKAEHRVDSESRNAGEEGGEGERENSAGEDDEAHLACDEIANSFHRLK